MVKKAGIYQMPLAEYVNDPAPAPSLNAGAAHALLTQSPQHAWMQHPKLNPAYEADASSRLDLGTVAHALLLENDESKVVIVEADDWRTKAAKEQRDEARAVGKQAILAKDYAVVLQMVMVAQEAMERSEVADDWKNATPEQTLIWKQDGIWCRSRPDKLTADGRVYFDYKTSAGTAHPAMFGKGPLIRHGYDLQAALGANGVLTLLYPENVTVIFVVQEIEPPFAVSLVSLSPQFMSIAQERVAIARAQWRHCLETDQWPGYPSRISYVEAPGYYGLETYENPEEAA